MGQRPLGPGGIHQDVRGGPPFHNVVDGSEDHGVAAAVGPQPVRHMAGEVIHQAVLIHQQKAVLRLDVGLAVLKGGGPDDLALDAEAHLALLVHGAGVGGAVLVPVDHPGHTLAVGLALHHGVVGRLDFGLLDLDGVRLFLRGVVLAGGIPAPAGGQAQGHGQNQCQQFSFHVRLSFLFFRGLWY